ncbi:MAG: ABC transporter permease [Thermoleophilia bacterium]|nr:ABC transporter permease [Thermoleophilia bacterium]
MVRFAFIARRLAHLAPLLLGIVFLVHLLLAITPGDPARVILGLRASQADIEALRAELGLDDSLPVQYGHYLADVAQGDLGTSIRSDRPVRGLIADRLPVTLWLMAAGSLFALLFAVPLALLAALRRDRVADHLARGFGLAALAMPSFWVGIMLIVFVALPTGAFPVAGFGDSLPEHVRAIVLPGITLGLALSPLLVRSLRSELIAVFDADYIAFARSLGVSRVRIVLRHALRNALVPVITILAVQVAYMLFGAVVVETTFALPGLGQAMTEAVATRDFPVVQGVTLVFAVLVVLVHLLADIVHALVDPRVELH